jgi:branched-chain amino acid aminotransferase
LGKMRESEKSETPQQGAICIDGELYSLEDAKISVLDRGFLYGDSVFEVMRTYGEKPFCEHEHLQRLVRSCQRLHIRCPLTTEALTSQIQQTIAASGLDECYLRVVITRGQGPIGLTISDQLKPIYLIYALPLQLLPTTIYEIGVKVALIASGRADAGVTPVGAKSSNYLNSILAIHRVKQQGNLEAIMVDAHNRVVEGASSNVFMVRGTELLTPSTDTGILEGITRNTVIALAETLGIEVKQTHLAPHDLKTADEVFLTSSIREIVPVIQIDDTKIGDAKPGETTQKLLAAYRGKATRTRPTTE